MKLAIFWIFVVRAIAAVAFAQEGTLGRPKITGIDHVDFYTTSAEANTRLYRTVLGLGIAAPTEPGQTQRFIVGEQWVGYSPAPEATATDRMDHIAFTTDDCAALRNYLASKGIKVPDCTGHLQDGSSSFTVKDPEGRRVEFVERPKSPLLGEIRSQIAAKAGAMPDPVSRRMIHAGFIVHDRKAEDHFYRDILGFHLYWRGGMQPGHTDWVAMQVPDGTDWLEYMLNVDAKPSLQLTGVMNHISLGVLDMKQAQAKLEARGWAHGDEHAQMGKDGKWQLNLFDPDSTRVELMEFTPSKKPCCSEFQGPHPHEP
jgi:catechol 2,3-dioxygenase-like lactoylglutathione lyase family enzyme